MAVMPPLIAGTRTFCPGSVAAASIATRSTSPATAPARAASICTTFGIDDYAEDLAQVTRKLDAPAILIGHSMGTAVVERYLERHQAPAAVLMAPVPPTGILGATMKIALTDPAFFGEQARATRGEYTAETLESIRDVYYSAETTSEDLIRFGPLFQSESRRAILDLTLLAMHFGGRRPGCRFSSSAAKRTRSSRRPCWASPPPAGRPRWR
jgi:pimeloyl-ACP methyl ester carboxylesterase